MPSRYCLNFRLGVFDNPISNPLKDFNDPGVGESSPELELDKAYMIQQERKQNTINEAFRNRYQGKSWL